MALCVTNLFPYMSLWVITMHKEANLDFPYIHKIKAVLTKTLFCFYGEELNVSSKLFKLINTSISMSNRCLFPRCSDVTKNWNKVKPLTSKDVAANYCGQGRTSTKLKTSSAKALFQMFFPFLKFEGHLTEYINFILQNKNKKVQAKQNSNYRTLF